MYNRLNKYLGKLEEIRTAPPDYKEQQTTDFTSYEKEAAIEALLTDYHLYLFDNKVEWEKMGTLIDLYEKYLNTLDDVDIAFFVENGIFCTRESAKLFRVKEITYEP